MAKEAAEELEALLLRLELVETAFFASSLSSAANHRSNGMRLTKLVYLLLGLVACNNSIDFEQRYVAPELLDGTVVAMADTFFQHCGGRDEVPFIVLVSRMPEGASEKAVGHCTKTPGGAVYLLKEWWLSASDKRRMFLISHELGHCALGLTHNANNWLMSSAMIPEDIAVDISEDEIWPALGCKN
jgi:hypothetical protein